MGKYISVRDRVKAKEDNGKSINNSYVSVRDRVNIQRKYTDIVEGINNIIADTNKLKTTDITKYGDYSATKLGYSALYSKIGGLNTSLNSIKNYISEENYNNLSKVLTDIQGTVKSNIDVTQNAIDFYGKFENEGQYTDWQNDIKFSTQYGDLTPQQVRDKIAEYSKKENRTADDEAYLKWLSNYDYNHGVKNDDYFNENVDYYNNLISEAKKSVSDLRNDVIFYGRGDKSRFSNSEEYYAAKKEIAKVDRLIEGYRSEISQLNSARTRYKNEQVFKDKGYSKYLDAEDFEEYVTKAQNTAADLVTKGDPIISAYLHPEQFDDVDEQTGSGAVILSYKMYTHFTPEEFKTYCYLSEKDKENGTNTAGQFAKDMENTLSMRTTDEWQAGIREDMMQGGFKGALATVGYNILSIPANILGGVPAVLGAAGDLIAGEDINVYGQSYAFVNFANTVRGTTGEMIGSDGWNLVYQSLMSAADSFVGATVFGSAYTYLMATTAAAGRAKQLVEQGASDGQIIIGSLASGLIEMATEKFSVENFLNGIKPTTFKQWMLATLQQAGIEASEEVASEVLNKITDEAIRGSMSDYNQLVRKYMQEEGLSEAEAKKKASQSAFKDIFEAAVGGFISGIAGGGFQGGIQMHNYKAVGNAIISKGEAETVLLAAESMGKLDPEIAGQVDALNKYSKNNNNAQSNATYKRMLGKVAVTTAQNSTEVKQNEVESALKSELKNRGVEGKVADKVIKSVSKYLTGQKLSSAEQGYLKNNSTAGSIVSEISAAQEAVKMGDTTSVANTTTSQQREGSSSAPEWAVSLVNRINIVDSATEIVNAAVTGKTKEEAKTQERNRMIKLLSIASGKTTAQQEAEAGDIPYSQYIKQKEAEQKENTAESGEVYSIDSSNDVIVLPKNNELSKLLGNLQGADKYKKIQQYILDILSGDSIKLSDGKTAVVDKRDALHIANKSGNKKTAEISQIKEIIEKAELYAEDTDVHHNKFDYFCYYHAKVEYDGNVFSLFINVGRAKNDGQYHIYDITEKLRDTANRINGLERPKPNEGYALKNDVSTDIIDQNKSTVNSKSMQESENNTSKAKEISEADRKKQAERKEKVKSLCDLFGLSLEWDEGIKRGKYNPDTRTVFINPNLTLIEMYIEVLKHEFTHDLENRRLYKKFKEYLFNSSENFIKFCEEEINELKKKGIIGEAATGKDAVLIYRGHIYEVYKSSKEMNDKERAEFDGEAAEREMICNFVSKRLLSRESETECIEALKELAEKQRTVFDRFMDLIRNFIYHIKQTFNKATEADEIKYLERRLKQVYDSKIGKNKTAQGGVSEHSIVVLENGNTYVSASRNIITGKTLSEKRKNISDFFKKLLNHNNSLDIYTIEGDILTISKSETANKARDNYKTVNNNRIKLSEEEFNLKLRVVSHIDEIAETSIKKDSEDDSKNHSFAENGFTYRTAYFEDFDGEYYKITFSVGNNRSTATIYNVGKIEKSVPSSAKIIAAVGSRALDETLSNNKVPQKDTTVNSNSMQENEKHSIDLEENVSKGDNRLLTDSDFADYMKVGGTLHTRNKKQRMLDNGKNPVLKTIQQVKDFIISAIYGEAPGEVRAYAKVGKKLANAILRINPSLNVYDNYIEINANDLRESFKRHSLPKENGDIPLSEIDFSNIPEHLNNFDYVLTTNTYNNKTEIHLAKKISDGYIKILTVSSKERGSIIVSKLIGISEEKFLEKYGKKIERDTGSLRGQTAETVDENPSTTAQFTAGALSNDSIPENSKKVNGNSKYSLDLEENVSEREETEDVSEEKNSADNKSIDIPAEAMKISNRYFKGEITKEEYQTEINDLLAKSGEEYGVFETGELAENKKQIPKKVTDDEYVRRMVRTIIESGTLPEDIETDVLAEVLKNALSYKRISNKKAQTQADLAVQDGTAVKQWEAAVNGDGKVGKKHIAIGETLLRMAAEQNDARAVMKLVCEISEMATRAGQTVQAFSMLKRMDGIGKLYYLQKCVDNINKDLQDRFLKKYSNGKLDKIPQVKINETLAAQLAQSKTKKDFDVTYEALLQSIAAQVPATFIDKWNAWRYFSMLFNSGTHIRNMSGNAIFLPAVRLKDVCAAVIENMTLEEQKRTKSVVVKKEYLKFGNEDYPNIEDMITGSGKMNPSNAIKDRQTVFKPKWLEALRKWNFELLEKEDTFFLKKHYAHALGGFLQARGIDISASIPFEVIEEARLYAMEEAAKATYRDTSALANAIQRFSRKNVFLNLLVEGNLPFKKTPINIVKRGIEYSPIGLIKTLTKGTYDLKKGDISASEYIDGIAGGLTGTGIMLMGMLLSSLGFIKFTGGFGDDEEDDINKLLGRQEYAVEIGGISYTIDWMAPACIPLFIGVELQNALEEEGNGNLWQSIKNVSSNALEPIINLSMLSGLENLIFSAKYTKEDAVVGTIAWEVALNYFSQAIPSIFGAAARTADKTRRTTYIDKTSWLSDMEQRAINKVASKIPFLSMLRSEYVDEFGRTQDNGNMFVRAIQNFISPGYISNIEYDPVIEDLRQLYKETGESVLPTKPKKYITVEGENIHLTAEQYEEYAIDVGQMRYEYIEEFFNSSAANSLSAEEKRQVISNLYSYAQAKGKTHISKYVLPDIYKKVYKAEQDGLSPVYYYISKIATNEDNADFNKDKSVTKKEKLRAVRNMNISNDIKAALIALYK